MKEKRFRRSRRDSGIDSKRWRRGHRSGTPVLLLLLLLFSLPFYPLGCGRQEEASSSTEYLEVDFERLPAHQYNDFPERENAERVIDSGKAIKLTFYGAARIVGGSCTLIEYKGTKILVDAGIFYLKNLTPLDRRFEFNPAELDHVILTHAHGDHSGRIPLLYREGYRGKIYSTPATKDVADVMLQLGAVIGVPKYRVDFKNKSVHSRSCELSRSLGPEEHLDLRQASVWLDIMGYHPCHRCRELMRGFKNHLSGEIDTWFETFPFGETVRLDDEISFRFHNAGHILGSSQVELTFGRGEEAVVIVFTGDYGNRISPVIKNPERPEKADYLITESTYGSVRKEFRRPYFKDFIDDLVAALHRGKRVIIPAFVLSKSQKVISLLAELVYLHQIPRDCPIIVTSPTAAKLNQVYQKYLQEDPESYFAPEVVRRKEWRNPFQCEQIYEGSIRSYEKKFGPLGTPAIFLVSSGMMEFASALEMAEKYLADTRTNFYIVGWQSPDSVGRAAMELPEVVIKGRVIPVKARVKRFGQFSSHADLNMLLENIGGYRDLKGVIVNHGEAESAVNLAQLIKKDYGLPVFVPAFLDTVWLDKKSFLRVRHDYSFSADKTRQLDPVLELPRATMKKDHRQAYESLALAERAYWDDKLAPALKHARRALLHYPTFADAHYLIGQIHQKQGRPRDARLSFQKAEKINPYDFRPYLALAKNYHRAGDDNRALVELRTCLFYQPDEIEALALLGDIYCSSGFDRMGMELLKAANNIDPYDEEASARLRQKVRELGKQEIYYIASRRSKVFHYPWCEHARNIDEENAIRHRERSDFIKQGFLPCSSCNP